MAGIGFKKSGNKGFKTFNKKPMGIQFVKSSDPVGHKPQPSGHGNKFVAGSNPNSFFSGNNTSITPSKSVQIPPSAPAPAASGSTKAASDSKTHFPLKGFVNSGESYSSLHFNDSKKPLFNLRTDKPWQTGMKRKNFGNGNNSKSPFIPGGNKFNKSGKGGKEKNNVVNVFQKGLIAKPPVRTVDEYQKAWKDEKDPVLAKIRNLAFTTVGMPDRPNAKDKLHSAANRISVKVELTSEPVLGAKGGCSSYRCHVLIDGVRICTEQAAKIKAATADAYESALQKILMPHLRLVQATSVTKELQASEKAFTVTPPAPKVPMQSTKDKNGDVVFRREESNAETAGRNFRFSNNEIKPLEEFVIVEPLWNTQELTAAHTIRTSADFNGMLLKYEYFFKGDAARCVLTIENQVLADVDGASKTTAKNKASAQALEKLKEFCWIIKTKSAVDSNTTISKDEMLSEFDQQPSSTNLTADSTSNVNNFGNKMLRKMGWEGGGVGKDGSGIAEPVAVKTLYSREGLGLSAANGVTDEFRKRVANVIETYAASDNQDDLVFDSDLRSDERKFIHEECRKFNLKSKSKGIGNGKGRFLCVSRKRSANQLFDHLMSVGGETMRYKLVPPPNYNSGGAGFGNHDFGGNNMPPHDGHYQNSANNHHQAYGPGFGNHDFGGNNMPPHDGHYQNSANNHHQAYGPGFGNHDFGANNMPPSDPHYQYSSSYHPVGYAHPHFGANRMPPPDPHYQYQNSARYQPAFGTGFGNPDFGANHMRPPNPHYQHSGNYHSTGFANPNFGANHMHPPNPHYQHSVNYHPAGSPNPNFGANDMPPPDKNYHKSARYQPAFGANRIPPSEGNYKTSTSRQPSSFGGNGNDEQSMECDEHSSFDGVDPYSQDGDGGQFLFPDTENDSQSSFKTNKCLERRPNLSTDDNIGRSRYPNLGENFDEFTPQQPSDGFEQDPYDQSSPSQQPTNSRSSNIRLQHDPYDKSSSAHQHNNSRFKDSGFQKDPYNKSSSSQLPKKSILKVKSTGFQQDSSDKSSSSKQPNNSRFNDAGFQKDPYDRSPSVGLAKKRGYPHSPLQQGSQSVPGSSGNEKGHGYSSYSGGGYDSYGGCGSDAWGYDSYSGGDDWGYDNYSGGDGSGSGHWDTSVDGRGGQSEAIPSHDDQYPQHGKRMNFGTYNNDHHGRSNITLTGDSSSKCKGASGNEKGRNSSSYGGSSDGSWDYDSYSGSSSSAGRWDKTEKKSVGGYGRSGPSTAISSHHSQYTHHGKSSFSRHDHHERKPSS